MSLSTNNTNVNQRLKRIVNLTDEECQELNTLGCINEEDLKYLTFADLPTSGITLVNRRKLETVSKYLIQGHFLNDTIRMDEIRDIVVNPNLQPIKKPKRKKPTPDEQQQQQEEEEIQQTDELTPIASSVHDTNTIPPGHAIRRYMTSNGVQEIIATIKKEGIKEKERKRCVVCCEKCTKNDSTHKYRIGYKTSTYCLNPKASSDHTERIFLCNMKRYQDHNELRDMTCFDIWHTPGYLNKVPRICFCKHHGK